MSYCFIDISNPSFSPFHFSAPLKTQVPFLSLHDEALELTACFPSSVIHAPKKVSPSFPVSLPFTLPLHLLLYYFPKQKTPSALTCTFQLLAPFSKHTSSNKPSLSLFFFQVSINNQFHTLKR